MIVNNFTHSEKKIGKILHEPDFPHILDSLGAETAQWYSSGLRAG
jgi:hypothetical protein